MSLLHTPRTHSLSPLQKKNNSLHSVHEGDKPFELELAWVCDASGRRFERVPADVAAAAEAAAKAALADSDMDE
jgi:20S proteasome subunit alpha 7